MNATPSTNKKVLVGILSVLISAGVLVACWFIFPKKYFYLVLICFVVVGMIAEHFVNIYSRKKKA
jgi:hypothetical protein